MVDKTELAQLDAQARTAYWAFEDTLAEYGSMHDETIIAWTLYRTFEERYLTAAHDAITAREV